MTTTYLTYDQVAARYQTHRTTISRWVARGIIPKPVPVGARTVRFIKEELDERDARRAEDREVRT